MSIGDLFSNLTDQEVKKAVTELFSWHSTCKLEDGVTRAIDKSLKEAHGIEDSISLRLAETKIFEEAAKRFCRKVED